MPPFVPFLFVFILEIVFRIFLAALFFLNFPHCNLSVAFIPSPTFLFNLAFPSSPLYNPASLFSFNFLPPVYFLSYTFLLRLILPLKSFIYNFPLIILPRFHSPLPLFVLAVYQFLLFNSRATERSFFFFIFSFLLLFSRPFFPLYVFRSLLRQLTFYT